MTVTVFHESDGYITYYADSDQLTAGDITEATPVGGGYIVVSAYPDPETEYVSGGAVVSRTAITVSDDLEVDADGVDAVWFEVPSGTTVSIIPKGREVAVAEETAASAGLVVIRANLVGAFTVLIEPPFPYIESEVSLHAVAVGTPADPTDTPPGSPVTVLTILLEVPTPTGLDVAAKPKAVRLRFNGSPWPYHSHFGVTRYTSSGDAAADTNGARYAPIYGAHYRDDEELTRGASYWYRLDAVDEFGNVSAKCAAVSVTYRGANSGDVEEGAITDAKADQTAPGTPTGLTVTQTAKTVDGGDGRVEIGMKATWTAPVGGVPVRRFRLEITDGTDTWYKYTKVSSYKFMGVVGKTYTIKVNAESYSGVEGAQTSGVALAPTANTATPTLPTWNASPILSRPNGVLLRFDRPSEKDFEEVAVFRATVNNSASAVEIGRSKSSRYLDQDALTIGTSYYYFLKGVNRSGVLSSAFSSSQTIVFRGLSGADSNFNAADTFAENTDFSLGASIGWSGGTSFIQSDPTNALSSSGYVFTRSYTGAASNQGIRNNARFPVVAGQQFVVGAKVKTDASWAGTGIGARLSFRDASMNELTVSSLSASGIAASQGWTDSVINVTVPSTAGIVWAVLEVFVYNQTAGQFWVSHAFARPAVVNDHLAAGRGTNLLINTNAARGTAFWKEFGDPNNVGTLTIRAKGDAWALAGEDVFEIAQTNGTSGSYSSYIHTDEYGNNRKIPVIPNKRYEFTLYTGAHRCLGIGGIIWYDSSNNVIGSISYTDSNDMQASGGTILSGYKRLGVIARAPSNASHCHVFVQKNNTTAGFGYTSSYLFFTHLFFGEAGETQTEYTPWSEHGTNRITDAITDQTAPGTPTGLTVTQVTTNTDAGDGRVEIAMRATWTAPSSGATVRRYKVEVTDGTDTWYDYVKQSSYKFHGVVGKTYTVKVNAESYSGVEGAQTAGVALAPTAKSGAPGSPTSVSIEVRAGQNKIAWTPPSDKDVLGYNVYFNTTNNSGTATKIADRVLTSFFVDAISRTAGTSCYYWIATVNRSLVEGTKVAASNNPQSARAILAADITPLTITATEVGSQAIVPSKLFPREFANLFHDPELVDKAESQITIGAVGASLNRIVNDNNNGLGPGIFSMVATATNDITKEIATSISIPVEVGITYNVSAYISGFADRVTVDDDFTPSIFVDFYRVDSSGNPTVSVGSSVEITWSTVSVGIRVEGEFYAPANAQKIRLRFRKTRQSVSANNAIYVGSPEVRRKTYIDEIYEGANLVPKYVFGTIGGLTISNDPSDPTNDITVSGGICATNDVVNPSMMQLNNDVIKRLDATWAAGTNQGGRDTGSIADGVWHVFVIGNSSSGAVDVLLSLSATSPTMPSGYSRKRRIGSIIRSGGTILAFKQRGNQFLLNTPILDVDVSQGTSANTRTLTVPTGIQVDALVRVYANNSVAYTALLSSLDVADAAPSSSAAPLATVGGPANTHTRASATVRTNTSGQIRTRASDASTTLRIATYGWIDER